MLSARRLRTAVAGFPDRRLQSVQPDPRIRRLPGQHRRATAGPIAGARRLAHTAGLGPDLSIARPDRRRKNRRPDAVVTVARHDRLARHTFLFADTLPARHAVLVAHAGRA